MKSQTRNALIVGGVVAVILVIVLWRALASRETEVIGVIDLGDIERAADGGTSEPGETGAAEAASSKQPATSGRQKRRAPLQLATATRVEDDSASSGAFEGRVVSWSTGEAVAGAELTWAHGGAVSSTRSDEEGEFTFEPDEPGPYELAVVAAEGYLPFAPEWGFSPIRLVARPGLRIHDITVSLRPAIDYQGQVLDPERNPASGAEVVILSTPGGQTELAPLTDRFTADEQGRFTFNAPDDAILEARAEGFSPGQAQLDTAAQVSHRLTIQLRSLEEGSNESQISGRVEDAEGDPVDNALIVARSQTLIQQRDEDEPRHSTQGLTDEDGRFTLTVADEQTYLVTATHADFATARAEDVAPDTDDLRLVLSEGATLSGQVRDRETDEPLAGFSVVVLLHTGELTRDPARTATVFDADGRYQVTGVGPGTYDVIATARDYAPTEPIEVVVPDPVPQEPIERDFALGRGGRLSGRIIDTETREPLEHARVSVESVAGSASSAVPLIASTTTDAQGQFEIRGLSAGLRSIVAAAYDHHSRIVSGLEMSDSGDVGPITIDLRPVAEGESPTLELTGIGVVLEARGDALIVGRMIEGGGAAEAGLQPGDGILAVEGEGVVDLGFQGSIERIRGPEGSTVRLTVRRAESGEIQEIDVPRRRISA